MKTFVLKLADYIHINTDWEISMICSADTEFANLLPDYIQYYPVSMQRGISISGVKAIFEIWKIFKREKFDLIQYATPNASLYASLAGKLAGIPVRLYCQWGIVYVGFQGLKRKIFKVEEKFVCSLSTHIEPDSRSNLKFSHIEGLYPESKGTVIWNGSACGVNLDKFDISKKAIFRQKIRAKYGISEDVFVYGFVGRITRDKGINELLGAYKAIYSGTEYLMLVGPNEADATIDAELYSWAQNNNHVIFTGFTSIVEEYLSAMDCYILPSYREGFGLGVIEAGAMEVPVIVTNIPGPIDSVSNGHTGIIINKANIEELIDAMMFFFRERKIARAWGKNGRMLVETMFEQSKLFSYILEDRKELLFPRGKNKWNQEN